MPVGPAEDDKVSVSEVTGVLTNAGFVVDMVDSQSLQYQYLLKAHKPH